MLQRLVTGSLLLALATGLWVSTTCVLHPVHVGSFVTAAAGAMMWVGAVAALGRRTWGVGLSLLAAVGFAAAAALEMGPWWFGVIATAGALPGALSWRPMARFDRGAAALFVGLSTALGLGAALAWHAVAWDVIAWFSVRCR